MKIEMRYIELKSGYSDDGPAWIAPVAFSKSGKTVYFNDHAFKRYNGINGNHIDIESGEEYWISGVKKASSNRHPCGRRAIMVAASVWDEFLSLTGQTHPDKSMYEVVDIPEVYPVERIRALENDNDL